MKYIMQFAIILVFSFAGEFLAYLLPFGIPASIYGMLLLFFCLLLGIIKLDRIKETGKFLLDIMPILFIPACVGVIDSWADVKLFLLPVILAVLLITPLVMIITGKTAQWMIRKKVTKNE